MLKLHQCDLSQFNAAPAQAASTQDPHDRTAASVNKGALNNGNNGDEEDDDEDEDFEAIFAAELAKEMEKMMGSMQPKAGNASSTTASSKKAGLTGGTDNSTLPDLDDEEKALLEDKDLKEAFERIMASAQAGGAGAGGDDDFSMEELSKLMNGLGGGGLPDFDALASGSATSNKSSSTKATTNGSSKPPAAAKPQNFEDALQATMSRLADSEAQHKSRTAKGGKGASDDPLAALMAQMESMGGPPGMGGKNGDDENLPEVLDSLMDQLMSKELLHEPITELKQKVTTATSFPARPEDTDQLSLQSSFSILNT